MTVHRCMHIVEIVGLNAWFSQCGCGFQEKVTGKLVEIVLLQYRIT